MSKQEPTEGQKARETIAETAVHTLFDFVRPVHDPEIRLQAACRLLDLV